MSRGRGGAGPGSHGSGASTHLESVTMAKKACERSGMALDKCFHAQPGPGPTGGSVDNHEDLQGAVAVARGVNSSQRTGVKGNQPTTKSGMLQRSEPRFLREYL